MMTVRSRMLGKTATVAWIVLCVGTVLWGAVPVQVAACTDPASSCVNGSTGTSGSSNSSGNGTESNSGPAVSGWAACGGVTGDPDTLFWPYPNWPAADSVPEPPLNALNPVTDLVMNSSGQVLFPQPMVPGNPYTTWNRATQSSPLYTNFGCVNYNPGAPVTKSYTFSTKSNTQVSNGAVLTPDSHMLVLTKFTANAYSAKIGFTGCSPATLGYSGGVTICSYGSAPGPITTGTIVTSAGPVQWSLPPASFTEPGSGPAGSSSGTPPAGTKSVGSYAYPGYEHVYPNASEKLPIQIESWRYITQTCSYTETTFTPIVNATGQVVGYQPSVQGPMPCTSAAFNFSGGVSAGGVSFTPYPPLSNSIQNAVRGMQTFISNPFDVQQIQTVSQSG